jgi:hypothetical protein
VAHGFKKFMDYESRPGPIPGRFESLGAPVTPRSGPKPKAE